MIEHVYIHEATELVTVQCHEFASEGNSSTAVLTGVARSSCTTPEWATPLHRHAMSATVTLDFVSDVILSKKELAAQGGTPNLPTKIIPTKIA